MDLLDLPPEVFARVITQLVTKAGIVEAWKCREVCRTFRRTIEFETLANQPTRAFLKSGELNARRILKHNMALYLSYRSIAENRAYNFLPNFIKRVCDSVSAGIPGYDHEMRRRHARILCELLVLKLNNVRKRVDAFKLLTNKAPETSTKLSDLTLDFVENQSSHIIAAAAAVGNLLALRTALADDIEKVWDRSQVFGYPLVSAAANGQLAIVRAIVKRFEQARLSKNLIEHEDQLKKATGAALANKHTMTAQFLLQAISAYGVEAKKDELDKWISTAFSTRNSEIISRVLTLRGAWDAQFEDEQASHDGDLEARCMFIEKSYVTGDLSYELCTLLQLAVDRKEPEMIEKVLKLVADPNRGYTDEPAQFLDYAIRNERKDLVGVLLRYGANPEPILEAWENREDNDQVIYTMLVEAKHRHKYYLSPTAPLIAADADDLVLPQAIQ